MTDEVTLGRRRWIIERIGGYSKLITRYRAVRPRWLWRLTSPFGKPTSRLVAQSGLEVRRGPFEGLVFPADALGHANYLGAKLLGTYEPDVIEFLAEQAPHSDVFVDVGSGDGFFCAGVARGSQIKVIGFETNPYERQMAMKQARLNGVKIELRGFADAEAIRDLPDGRLLILCDIEGFEQDLLDPVLSPRLKEAKMVVEIHEHVRPGVGRILHDRFEATHLIERIPMRPRNTDLPELAGWPAADAELAVNDGHALRDSWMTFVPR